MSDEQILNIPVESEEKFNDSNVFNEYEDIGDKPSTLLQSSQAEKFETLNSSSTQLSKDSKNQDEELGKPIKLPSIESSELSFSIGLNISDNKSSVTEKSDQVKDETTNNVESERQIKSKLTIQKPQNYLKRCECFKQSYEKLINNVKFKISQATVEEYVEESDNTEKSEIKTELDQSSKNVTAVQSNEMYNPTETQSSMSVNISEEITEEANCEMLEPNHVLWKLPTKFQSSISYITAKSSQKTTMEFTGQTDCANSKTYIRLEGGTFCKTTTTYPDISSGQYTGNSSGKITLDKTSSVSDLDPANFLKTDTCTCTCSLNRDTNCSRNTDPSSSPTKRFNSTSPEENISENNQKKTLYFDCYTSTPSTTGTDSEIANWLKNKAMEKGKVRYAITRITEYSHFTTYEIMKSTKKVPKCMPKEIEGVFVLRHRNI